MSWQIRAAASSWCINTVRLQVAPDNLLGSTGNSYSAVFMGILEREVSLAERFHMVVVVSAQTESLGRQPGPTGITVKFWKYLARAYRTDPQVVFDLFNEPRLGLRGKLSNGEIWRLWQAGGQYDGKAYFGMQALADDVRSHGARNLLWVEGPRYANTLTGVRTHRITGSPLMYDIHHPRGPHDRASWNRDFGYLVNRNIAPVVDGEWTNYAAGKGECWTNAPTAVPSYLNYLQSMHIGMTVWALLGGVMTDATNFDAPTQIESDWTCQYGLDEGAGALILRWFKRNNGPARPRRTSTVRIRTAAPG